MTNQKCLYRWCQHQVEQVPGGHRQRLYCSKRCRMRAYRERHEPEREERKRQAYMNRWQQERAELTARFGDDLSLKTERFLLDLQHHDPGLADQVGHILVHERERLFVPPEKLKGESRRLGELLVEAQAMEATQPHGIQNLPHAYIILETILLELTWPASHRDLIHQIFMACSRSVLHDESSSQ